ncbi:MAG: hypothetical protein ABIP97_07630 [Chthoniobacterales bacterium]
MKNNQRFASLGTSYEWKPLIDEEKQVDPKIYSRRGVHVVNPRRLRLVIDFDPVHFGSQNILYADGHVLAVLMSAKSLLDSFDIVSDMPDITAEFLRIVLDLCAGLIDDAVGLVCDTTGHGVIIMVCAGAQTNDQKKAGGGPKHSRHIS